MARIEDLVSKVSDQELQRELRDAVARFKKCQRFGIVFEEHVPENSVLQGLSLHLGDLVQLREKLSQNISYRVTSISKVGIVTIEKVENTQDVLEVPSQSLVVIKRFGEPIYPALRSLGGVRNGTASNPFHSVINGENYHALQLFLYMFEGQVDCIYIDPPYNTGACDWKYNNRFVDSTDSWRHSKWLSFIEKRLLLARRLLKPDGVLIVTIDEHELFHLGMLLERIFPEYLKYTITIVINPKGIFQFNFARVDEQAIFIVPNTGKNVIQGSPVDQSTLPLEGDEESQGIDGLQPSEDEDTGEDDEEDDEEDEEEDDEEDDDVDLDTDEITSNGPCRYETPEGYKQDHARRRGNHSLRTDRRNMFYPIFIDEKNRRVVRAGESIPLDEEPDFTYVDGLRPIWPIDTRGVHRIWRLGSASMQADIDAEKVVLGKYNRRRDTWTINLVRPIKEEKKIKTVWQDASYDAGTHGTTLLAKFLGTPRTFPFPKSIYAVKDCLAAVTRNRPNALIIDLFAGSGTTLHATCLLNSEDKGQRRCILVTNNEVSGQEATQLNREGYYVGDPEYEAQGIFEKVTRPRCEAMITGIRPDGKPVEGNYKNSQPFSNGFKENVEFFQLEYLDPDDVELGSQFNAILPIIWIASGGIGDMEYDPDMVDLGFSVPSTSKYAVLFRESRFRQFQEVLKQRPDVTHVWLVTDSEEAFSEMRSSLPSKLWVSMLYRDYLRNFSINLVRNI